MASGNVVEKLCKTVTEAKGSSTTAQIEGTVKADLPGLLKKFLNIEASSTGTGYNKELREKMEQWTLETELEDQANMGKPTLDTATAIRDGVKTTYQNYLAATRSNSKSTTVCAAEVQILVQQWRSITDMTSSLSKDINDMAMTAVRTLR
jgi:hypothetical protein